MYRTGGVSQRFVLQVVHMEQLVAETCRLLCPGLNPEVSISLIWPWPISLQYYLNLGYVSLQIMANQVRPGDNEASDWSVTKLLHEGIARA